MGITGVLLHNNEYFAQVLEGNIEAIGDSYGRLLRGVRHHNVMRLTSGRSTVRRFGDRAMSFYAVEPAQLAQARGWGEAVGSLRVGAGWGVPCPRGTTAPVPRPWPCYGKQLGRA